MRREMLRWVSFTAGSAFVAGALLAPAADAAVVICKRKNKIQLRETACKSKETQIAATELGATGPQGPQGPAGTVGPAGPGAAWALVDKDGTILAQSGGLSVSAGTAASYLVGFGAGSTRAQAEMYFVDADSGQVMLVTADRRLASMGMFGGDDEDFLRESFNNMARDLVKFLTRLPKDFKVAVVAAPPQSTAPEIAPASAKVKALVGTWSGTIYAQRATYPLTITFRDDGSWHATSPTLKPGTFDGAWRLNGSNVIWTSSITGRTGTATLHEANGTRILRLIPDAGSSTIELTPAR